MKNENVDRQLDYTHSQIVFTDTKAAAIMVINGFVINLVTKLDYSVMRYCTIGVLIIGILLSAIVIVPRTRFSNSKGVIFFGNIAKSSKEVFINKLRELSDEEFLEKKIEQLYYLSKIANLKLVWLKLAFYISFAGYFMLTLLGIFFFI